MWGMAGWYSPVRDLVHERATVGAMTDTMALRGPDAGGVRPRPRVGLGHRRLAVIDFVERLNGIYAFGIWDSGKAPATLCGQGRLSARIDMTELRNEESR